MDYGFYLEALELLNRQENYLISNCKLTFACDYKHQIWQNSKESIGILSLGIIMDTISFVSGLDFPVYMDTFTVPS